MATITHAATATWSTTGGNTQVTATPAAGDLIVVVAPCTSTGTTSAVSDNNSDGLGAYTQVDTTRTGWSTNGKLTVWVRNALVGSGTSTVFTATQTSSTGGGLDVFRVSGMVRTGAGAVRSNGGQSTGTAGTTPAPVLSQTPLTGNPIITAVCNGTNVAGVTQPTSYTQASNLGYNTPASGLDTAFINSGITNATITWGSTSASAFGSVAIELDTSVPVGPPLGTQNMPSGTRLVLVRTGVAMASLIRPPAVAPPPSTGPVFFPAVQAVRAKYLPHFPVAGSQASELGAGTGNIAGAVNGAGFGSGNGAMGAPVQNPTAGPAFRQATQALRARTPVPFLKGRCYSTPTTPARNPAVGPVFRQKPAPVRYILPPWQPRAGRIGSSPGGPVINPRRGPPVYAPLGPARARQPLPARGRAAGNKGAPVQNPAPSGVGPPFRQATQPARARIPRNGPRGRIAFNAGAPVRNPNVILVSGAMPGPVRAALPVPARGRVTVRPSTVTVQPATGPAFRPATGPARARIPQTFSKGRAASSPGAPVRNPRLGPVFRQATQPCRIRPSLPPRGRVASGRGAPVTPPPPVTSGPPVYGQIQGAAAVRWAGRSRAGSGGSSLVQNPAPGPVFTQAVRALRAKLPYFPPPRGRVTVSRTIPPVPVPGVVAVTGAIGGAVRAALPVVLRGRIVFRAGGPVVNPAPPTTGPVFRQATSPARIRPALPPRGRAASNPGGPVRNPSPPATGPVFRPVTQAVRARQPVPFLKGRVASSPGGPLRTQGPPVSSGQPAGIRVIYLYTGRSRSTQKPAPVRNPSQGPVFRQAVRPVQARFPLPPKGRVASNPGAPVQNPPPVVIGPPFTPRHDPARIRPSLPPRGRAASNPGAPVRNPHLGAVFPAAHGPVQARIPQTWSKGRAAGNPGGPLVTRGPRFIQAPQPARIRPSLPSRGRTASNPGGPVQNPPPPILGPVFYPFRQAVHIRFTLPPKGRVASGKGAPVRNPVQGAAFPAWHGPVQARQPLPPRGRVVSNPGGPLRNPPALGPAIPQRGQPVQARFPLPPRGRTAGSPGAPLVTQGPVFRQFTHPVQARQPLPLRGRTGSNPGIPVPPPQVGARFISRHDPARIRPSLPPRGRVSANRGAPVRNPRPGPVFRQAIKPIRAVIPQNAPRGRTGSNPGGPVQNIPVATLLFRLGSPYFQWDTGTPGMVSEWNLGTPVFAWDTGVPETST